MSERFDYIRVAFRGSVEEAVAWKQRYEGLAYDYCEPRKMQPKQVCSTDRYYDNAAKEWIDTFEAWGQFADYVVDNMPVAHRGQVLRLDYRMSFDRLGIRAETIYHVVKTNKKRTRRTITQIDSPPRQKKGDRDAGGDFLSVGSKGSERRTALYKRGDEPYALEVQFGKGFPLKMHQEAVDLYLNTQGMAYSDALRKVAYHHFEQAVRDHLHFTVEMITGEESARIQDSVLSHQESLLEGFDLYWEQMDETAREVVAEKVIADTKNRAIITSEPVEPDGWWDGYGLPDIA